MMINSSEVKALVFDLMGTYTDWHKSILSAIIRYSNPPPPPLTLDDLPDLASEWRAGFFRSIMASCEAGEESPDIDTVHATALDQILNDRGVSHNVWNSEVETIISTRTNGSACPAEQALINPLKEIIQRSMRSSIRQPNPAIYKKAVDLLGLQPSETAMVAAHAYDLRAAAAV